MDDKEPLDLGASLLFRLSLNIYQRSKMCTYEEKGHLSVENTEEGEESKVERNDQPI